MSFMKSLLAVVLTASLLACGSPADVAGDYTIAVTNGENGCNFENWAMGDTASNIPVTIVQDGDTATATVEGLVGVFVALALGDNVYSGEVDGSELYLSIIGTRATTEGNCTYTLNSYIDAVIDGDLLQGEIRYQAATNDNSDCASIEGCVTVQQFNGTRPPSAN